MPAGSRNIRPPYNTAMTFPAPASAEPTTAPNHSPSDRSVSPALRMEGVSLARRRRWALTLVDLQVDVGEVVGLLGPNGAGKTSLLELAAGLMSPRHGRIRLFGKAPNPLTRARVGLLADPPHLLPGFTVDALLQHEDRQVQAVCPARHPGDALREALIAQWALSPLLQRQTTSLSHGQRQRVGLALVLLKRPELLLLDEPTNGLDPLQQRSLQTRLEALRGQIAIVVSSHQLHTLGAVCDRVLLLHEGAIVGESRRSAAERILVGVAEGAAASLMRDFGPEIEVAVLEKDRLVLGGCEPDALLKAVSIAAARHGVTLTEIRRLPPLSAESLEAQLLAGVTGESGGVP